MREGEVLDLLMERGETVGVYSCGRLSVAMVGSVLVGSSTGAGDGLTVMLPETPRIALSFDCDGVVKLCPLTEPADTLRTSGTVTGSVWIN